MKTLFVSRTLHYLTRLALSTAAACPFFSASAAPPGHNIAAGNITVIQNDTGNLTNSITALLSLAINDFRLRGFGGDNDTNSPLMSRADYPVQIGPDAGANFTNGILIPSVTENGRDNGEGNGTNFAICFVENQRTNKNDTNATVGAYWIGTQGATNGPNGGAGTPPEYNFNVAGAYFPYTSWVGGFARNHGPNDENGQFNAANPDTFGGFTNGGVLNQLISSPGLAIGANFFDLGSGKYFVTLTNIGIDSRSDGILLVTGAKNESANYGLSQVNAANGGWNLFIKDQGNNTAATFEADPIAFVFVPKTNTTVVSGRFLGNGSIAMFSGASAQFTVTSNAVGTYELKLTNGMQPTNGVLIITAGGGETINQDNYVSYQLNGAKDGWIIQSRDCAPAALESPGATETVANFIFIPAATPGFTVVPTNGLLTTESGGQDTFTVVLDTQPQTDVTIAVSSSDLTEGTVSTNSLTFTHDNWNVPQTVTITGVDDGLLDGAVAYTIVLGVASSADGNYNGLNPSDVSVVNADNEGGITVSPTSGLVTTEAGGTNSFDIVLNTQPAASVTIGFSSSDTTEGTVSPSSVTFTTGNWNVPRTITVTGVDDFVHDGNIAYTIITAPATSGDPTYSGLNPPDVSVINLDDDTVGVTVNVGLNVVPVVEGKTNGYTVVLDSQPTNNVTVNIASSNTSQGGTVSPTTLTFTPGNWSNAQPVTVTAADDLVVDGDTFWTNTLTFSSSDSLYAALAPIRVSVRTLDNEGVLTFVSGDLIYGFGQQGLVIDGRATLSDPNTPNYNSGNLTVTLTANGTSSDRLEIRNTGTGAGQIGVAGNVVSYGGTPIGTFSGGTGLTPLAIALNGSATPAATEALVRDISFRNVNSSTLANRRSVSFVLTDADGGVSSAATGVRVGLLRATIFQEGADHGYGTYTGEIDTEMRSGNPNTSFPSGGGAGGLTIDWPDPGGNQIESLMRWENILGNALSQVPTNAVIVSADMALYIDPTVANTQGDGAALHRMLLPFDGTNDTWSNWGDGVDTDDGEARSAYDSQLGVAGDGVTAPAGDSGTGYVIVGVTADIQAWANGDANYGWVFKAWTNGTDALTFRSSEATNIDQRPLLRILWLPAGTASASFRQGVNGYTGTADTRIRQSAPDASATTSTAVFVDYDVAGNSTFNPDEVLIRFDNIVGSGIGQVPAGATIHAAMLGLATVNNNGYGDGGQFFAMLTPWQDTSTWNSLVNGVTADGIEAQATPTTSAGSATLNPNVCGGFMSFEVTSDVQAWASGVRANNGWVILPWTNGGDGWGVSMSESTIERERPQLRVYYTPALTLSSISRGPSNAVITFAGPASTPCTVLRATVVTGPYTNIGSTATDGTGNGTFTDNSPPAGQAFYRLSSP